MRRSEAQAKLEYDMTGLHLVVEPLNEGPTPEASFNDSDPERVTLRLPKELKDLIDSLASRHGMSANNWYVRELSRVIGRSVRDSMDDVRDEMRVWPAWLPRHAAANSRDSLGASDERLD